MSSTNPSAGTYPGGTTYPGVTVSPPPPVTATRTEILTVDGVVLHTWAKNPIDMLSAVRTPARRSNDVVIAGRHGTLRTKAKFYDANVLTLPFWVQGRDDTGKIPGGSTARIEFQKRIDELTSLFSRAGVRDVRITRADGSIRQCFAEVLDVIDFSQGANWRDPYANFVVTLVMADPFWGDIAPVTFTQANPVMGGVYTMAPLAGGNAPIVDALITLTGPWTNPVIEAYVNGAPPDRPISLSYAGVLAATRTLIFDCSNWTLSGTGAPNYALVNHVGSSRFLELLPGTQLTAPQVKVSGSATTSGTSISVSARRKFLTP